MPASLLPQVLTAWFEIWRNLVTDPKQWNELNQTMLSFGSWTCIYYQTSQKNWVKLVSYMFQGHNLISRNTQTYLRPWNIFKLICMCFHQMFCTVFIFRGQMHMRFFSLPTHTHVVNLCQQIYQLHAHLIFSKSLSTLNHLDLQIIWIDLD